MQLRGPERLLHGGADGVELVVAGHLLGEGAAVVLEDDEVAEQGEEAVSARRPLPIITCNSVR